MKFLIRFEHREYDLVIGHREKIGQRTIEAKRMQDALNWFNVIERKYISGNVRVISIKRKL